ncbi:MAG: outer membrane beta-barrel protein [Helicobacteraceae bacterium]|jgi:opacity protein-like surface antigen|nr:outer membrane beta-barrel protein [Helicobacteraceae bacterium]
MKKLLVVILAASFANGALLADDGWQISIGAHMSKFKVSSGRDSESEKNTSLSIAIGKEIMKTDSGNLLLELSFMTPEKWEYSESYKEKEYVSGSYYYNYSGSGSVKAEMKMALFANLYYQFNTAVAGLKPYLGAGLGLASLKYSWSGSGSGIYCNYLYGGYSCEDYDDSDGYSKTAKAVAYQLALGADYFFNKNIALGLGYGYRNYGSIEIGEDYDKTDIEVKSSGVFGKLTFRF